MKKAKCKLCGKYEMKEKEVGKLKSKLLSELSPGLEIPCFRQWKWCRLNNNWCRNVAGSCGEIITKPEKKMEGEANEIL